MKTLLESTLVQQKVVWDTLSQGREKWHDFLVDFLKPMGDEMVRVLQLKNNDTILDLATGTGEPGLTFAGLVTKGRVVGTDISQDMLRIAQSKAVQKGFTNYQTVNCGVDDLPFADNTFDAVSCRNGFMFFPDLAGAIREQYRVLKPGRCIAASVWGVPNRNGWVSTPMRLILSNTPGLPTIPEEVSLFRCAEARLIANLFLETGLKNVMENYVRGRVSYPSKEVYWQFITEVSAPVALALNLLDASTQMKIKHELFGCIQEISPKGSIEFDFEALVISGEK